MDEWVSLLTGCHSSYLQVNSKKQTKQKKTTKDLIAELKATLCNLFTLKQQLQKQVNGRVSYNSVNGVSVTVTLIPLICCCTM